MTVAPWLTTAAAAALGLALGPAFDRAVQRLPHHPASPTDVYSPDHDQPMRQHLVAFEAVSVRRMGVATVDRMPGGSGPCPPDCRRPLRHRRRWLSLLTAAVFASIAARRGASVDLGPALALSGMLIPLAFCDLEHYLLPRKLVWGGTLAIVAAIGGSALTARSGTGAVLTALECAGASGAVLGAISLANPRWLGFGDVRLAFPIGLGLGWFGPGAVLLGFMASCLGSGLVGGALLAAGRVKRSQALPFGVFLAGGTIVALLLSP